MTIKQGFPYQELWMTCSKNKVNTERKEMFKKILVGSLMLIFIMGVYNCGQKEEISEARFLVLSDTVMQKMDFKVWEPLAFELSKNYPEKDMTVMVMLQGVEQSIAEGDDETVEKWTNLVLNYPETEILSLEDRAAFANRIAWRLNEAARLPELGIKMAKQAVDVFLKVDATIEHYGEMGAMIYDTYGVFLLEMKDSTASLDAFGKSMDYYEFPETVTRLAALFDEMGNKDKALENYTRAWALNPSNIELSFRIKELYGELNPSENAETYISDLHESFLEGKKEEIITGQTSMPSPDFKLVDFNGKTYSKAELAGKVIFVDFWATWCGPCRRELPEYQKLFDLHKDSGKVIFLAVSTDQDRLKVAPFIAEQKFTFPVAHNPNLAGEFGVEGIPSLFILDTQGNIAYSIVGYDPNSDFVQEMTWRIESLID